MSHHPSTSIGSRDIKTNFGTIFTAALKDYQKQTKRDISSHPLAAQLQSCDSPSAVLAVLRAQARAFNQAQNTDDKFIKWLDPTINVLYALSATLGNGVGLVTAKHQPLKTYPLICMDTDILACQCDFHWDWCPPPGEHLSTCLCDTTTHRHRYLIGR